MAGQSNSDGRVRANFDADGRGVLGIDAFAVSADPLRRRKRFHTEFTREGRELNEREAAKLEARMRAQRES